MNTQNFRVFFLVSLVLGLVVGSVCITYDAHARVPALTSEYLKLTAYFSNMIVAIGLLGLTAYSLKLLALTPPKIEPTISNRPDIDALKSRLKIVEDKLAKSSCDLEQMTKLTELASRLQKKTTIATGEGSTKVVTETVEPSFAFTEQLDAFFLQLNNKPSDTPIETDRHA
jgi:hypothetical protein